MQSLSLAASGSAEEVSVDCILPSAHVRRDVSFSVSFENFLSAELRSDRQCRLEPDFIESPLFNNRPSVLMAGESIQRFSLDGVDVSTNDKLVLKLVPPHPLRRAKDLDAFFLSHESGLAPESSEHAGDFVVVCDCTTGVSGCIISRHWKASEKPSLVWQPDGDADEPIDVVGLRVRDTGVGARRGAPEALASEPLAHRR
ncbi:hypothetical protein I4F81_008661 [Pyropia yezoensis]|uniref:Uncharacterized protein n=1 Tax=Pyropia yezoensis TaxID=2788 RepID=A0ACC3C842_PYRYE|nr:hypothetical protein I4F81_008661 [Neopyropia yezoensis]